MSVTNFSAFLYISVCILLNIHITPFLRDMHAFSLGQAKEKCLKQAATTRKLWEAEVQKSTKEIERQEAAVQKLRGIFCALTCFVQQKQPNLTYIFAQGGSLYITI